MRSRFIVSRHLGVTPALLALASLGGSAFAGGLTPVTTNASGEKLNAGGFDACPSDDGRYIAFATLSKNTGTTTSGFSYQVYLKDTTLGTLTLLSKSPAGVAGNGHSVPLDITPDGRFVLFNSIATNFAAGETVAQDTFVVDVSTGALQKVSVSTNGGLANAATGNGRISADGTKVVFRSSASNLVPGDTNNAADVFLRNLTTSTTTRVNVAPNGQQDVNVVDNEPSISDDGRYVCFMTRSKWAAEDVNLGGADVYVKDMVTGQYQIAAINLNGVTSTSSVPSSFGLISGDGKTVVFDSAASDLIAPPPGNGGSQLYARRLDTGVTTLVSTPSGAPNPAATGAAAGTIVLDDVSRDGRFVLFRSSAANLSLADTTNGNDELYLRDTLGSRTAPVALTPNGMTTPGSGYRARFARNGRSFVFTSQDPALWSGDSGSSPDLFWMSDYGFSEAGAALIGTNGVPRLTGTGTLLPGSANGLDLSGALPSAAVVLVYSTSYEPLPFKGGTLLTGAAAIFTLTIVTNGLGKSSLPFTMPPGPVASGAVTVQCLITDGLAPQGVAQSNGIFLHIP